MSDVIQKMHKRFAERKLELRKRRLSFKAAEARLVTLFEDVAPLGCEPYTDGDWIFVSVTGDKQAFLAFARVIRKHGFELPKIEKGATSFTKLEMIDELPLYFTFNSTACRRVKVGTKMVEQDVFETVCDELMPYEPAAPKPQTAEVVDEIPF